MNRHMTEEDLAIQAQARAFVEEELIPHEVEAELNEGRLPEGVKATQKARIKEMGLQAFNIEAKLGGAGLSCFQQVLVSEQAGRATNALGWVFDAPASWLPKVATEHQMHTWVLPAIRGERKECYAITEELAGSDVDAIQATVTKDGDFYVLDGVKWHVTSFNHADHVFFQGKLPDGSHALLVSDLDNPGISVVRTPAYMHTYAAHHPIVSFEGVRVPKANLIGEEGDGMRFAYEWFRYERLMIAA
ncbi:MAG: acyl-CoA dehydrogenase family protein, partial [Actinomycetota bacterium]